jgi:6-phosphogluconolactonase
MGSMSLQLRRVKLSSSAAALLAAFVLSLTGCGNFFVYPGSQNGSTTSGTGDYAYVSNVSGSNEINGYQLSSGTLVPTTSSPYSVGYVPQAMVVNPANTYLYVASQLNAGSGYIYGYTIGTGGVLTGLNSSNALLQENSAAIDISSDGQWLFSLNASGTTMEQYGINSTTGILTREASYAITGSPNGIVTPESIKVAPSGLFIVCTLGDGGTNIFSLQTSSGTVGGANIINPGNTAAGDFGLAIDSSNYVYLGRSTGLVVFSVNSTGAGTLDGSATGYAVGSGNYTIAINQANTFVYLGSLNTSATSDIYGFSGVGTGTLKALAPASTVAPTDVEAMGRDNSGSYLLTLGYSASSGLQLFTIGSNGALSLNGSAATGTATSVPSAMALTH